MKKLTGVVAPIVTPLTEDDKIDGVSLENLCEYLIEKGITCLYPNGTTGEMMYLTTEERKQVAEVTVKTSNARVPVFIHVGGWNQAQTIELAQHAANIGADGIGVVTPSFFKLSDQALFEFYKAVSESVPKDFSIYLYAIPQCAVNDITPELAARIAEECPNVVGIKYSYPNMSRIQQMMTIRDGEFSVLCGPDELFEVTVCAGGDGTVSGNSQCIPEHYAALWKAIQNKDYDLATRLQRRTNTLNDILCEFNNIAHYKVVLKEEKILACSAMRKPMEALTDEQTRSVMEKLNALDFHKVI